MLNRLRAEILFSRGQGLAGPATWDQCIQCYDRAIDLAPAYSGIYLQKALALAGIGKQAEAAEELETAISLASGNPAGHLFLGIICYDNGQLDDARQHFDTALALAPDNQLALCFKHLTSMARNEDMDEAMHVIGAHVQNTNAEFQSRLLFFCETFILQHKEKARYPDEAFFHASWMKGADENESALSRMGTKAVFFLDAAWMHLSCLFSPKKRKAFAHYRAAGEKLKQGGLDASEAELKHALDCFPGYEEAKDQLLDIYFYKRDYEAVHQIIRDGSEFDDLEDRAGRDDDGAGDRAGFDRCLPWISLLGVYYFHVGDYGRAMELLDYTGKFMDDYYHCFYLGVCALATNDLNTARKYFRESTERLNPEIAKLRLDEMERLRKII